MSNQCNCLLTEKHCHDVMLHINHIQMVHTLHTVNLVITLTFYIYFLHHNGRQSQNLFIDPQQIKKILKYLYFCFLVKSTAGFEFPGNNE